MVDSSVNQSGRYKAYPEYKHSGVEWLGEIPRHWGLLRGKWRFKSLKEVNRNLQCMDRLALTMRGVIERSIDSDDGLQPSAFTGYQIFEKDDLVFKLIDLENYKTSRVGLVFKKGIMSPAYIRLKPNKGMSSKFFYYFYFDLYLRGIYNQIGGQGVRSALNASDLLEIEICVPSREEQAEIADFLDYETAKIDTLIEKQQRLIELLTEKRQATISHAVTKGLNPDVPMKDSGVEWLGEVPAHWEVKSLKYVARLRSLKTQPSATRYVGLENVESNTGKYLATEDLMPTGISNVFDKDNLLFGKLRPYLAKSWLATFSGICSSEFLVLESILVHPKYLNYLTLSNRFIDEVNSSTYGSKMPRASWDFISLMPIPTMDYDTSKDIAEFLDEELIKFDEVISKANQQIQLMQERRTALISAAVTGKIDVRDWVKPE